MSSPMEAAGQQRDGPVKQVRKLEDATVVTLTGEIDMYCSREVRQVLLEATGEKTPAIVVDVREVPHMDSSGVATLVEALQRVKRYDGRLVLVGLQERVKSVFEIAKLTDLFEIKPDLQEVLGNG